MLECRGAEEKGEANSRWADAVIAKMRNAVERMNLVITFEFMVNHAKVRKNAH